MSMRTHFAPAERATASELVRDISHITNNPIINTLMNVSFGLFAVLNDKRQILSLNRSFLDLLGVENVETILGLRPGEYIGCINATEMPGGCGTSTRCSECGAVVTILAALESDAPQEDTCKLTVKRDNRGVDLLFKVKCCRTTIGEERFLLLFLQDVTPLKEEAFQELHSIIDNANDGFMIIDSEGRLLDVNRSYCNMSGYARNELLSMTIADLTVDEENDIKRHLDHVAGAGAACFETRHRRKDGLIMDVEASATYSHELGGRIYSFNRDISERKHNEKMLRRYQEELQRLNTDLESRVIERTSELAEAKMRAEEADRIKSAFLATMSHELRTPLNSIIGFAGILQQEMPGPLNTEQKKQMDIVRSSARHLLDLINDVLDLSKIEAGQLTLINQTLDLREVIEKACRSMQPLAEKKGLALIVDIASEITNIHRDRRRVEQVILNLLSNAIKFTEKGNVGVMCRRDGDFHKIVVTDTGIGISAEDLGKLFLPFCQLEIGLNRRFEGTGLGLCICKKLVDLLGGEIWAESEEGKGSMFCFTLPDEVGEK